MKKIFVKITALIMILALSLSFAGCSLFDDSASNSVTDGNTNRPSGTQVLNKTEFGTIEGERVKKDKTEVWEMVSKSVVAIGTSVGSGSGVIVDINVTNENGIVQDMPNEFYVVTCHHVIDAMGDITIYLPDAENDNVGESDYDDQNYVFKGKIGGGIHENLAVTLVGADQKSDIALLKLTVEDSQIASKIVKAKLPPQTGYNMKVLEEVIAIGNSAGDLPGTASFGAISYINRETSVGSVGDLTLLQINVDIYHGNSGGGLFNLYGELIGITNAGREATVTEDGKTVESYSGLNFAIPYVVDQNAGADDYGFMNVVSQLLATKTATNYGYVPGRAGLFGFTTTQQVNSQYVQVTSVTNGTIAYGKLRVGDTILKVVKGDKSQLASANVITSNAEVSAVFKTLKAGDTVSLLVSRPGAVGYVEVEMTAVQYIFCDTGN